LGERSGREKSLRGQGLTRQGPGRPAQRRVCCGLGEKPGPATDFIGKWSEWQDLGVSDHSRLNLLAFFKLPVLLVYPIYVKWWLNQPLT
jgi:hypothetical protein